MKLFTYLALLGTLKAALPEEERVYSLNADEYPDFSKEDWGMYSGYVNLPSSDKHIHYLLVQSQQESRETDPLIIWFNGGPGCSSMLAFLQENGPFLVADGESTFKKSEYSWNREANVLYIEQPAGVGYSYCGNPDECSSWNDNNVAEDNLAAVLLWFEKYADFKPNDLYISGESYAGIYVPYLVNQIHHHNIATLGTDAFRPNLKGMMVGNGVTNWKYDTTPAFMEMGYWHSLYSTETYDAMQANKCDYSGMPWGKNPSDECLMLAEKFEKATNNVNIYNILGECYGLNNTNAYQPEDRALKVHKGSLISYKKVFTPKDYTPWLYTNSKGEDYRLTPPCVDGAFVTEFLNRDQVKKSLFISDNVEAWQMCQGDINYDRLEIGSQWIWESLKGQYRMLKFSGDTDGAVPTTGTLGWIRSMNRTVLEKWRPYFIDAAETMLGGYIEEYDGLTLGTVHGAGHMAPQFKPAETYHLIFNWLKGTPI